jgi:hypothetical protein
MRFYILIALGIFVLLAQPMPSGNVALGLAAIAGGVFWLWATKRSEKGNIIQDENKLKNFRIVLYSIVGLLVLMMLYAATKAP